MDSSETISDEFQRLYDTRESLRLQQAEATDLTADLYGNAIEAATTRLTELASQPEVRDYLTRLGGTAVRGLTELERIDESGLVEPEAMEGKRSEIEKLKSNPAVRMAIEFLSPPHLPEAAPTRPKRYASTKQI